MFAGISVGLSSFGKEKVVYWRDASTGMSTLAYYIGKFIIDVPRLLLAGVIYSAALTLLFPFKQSWLDILWIVEAVYFVSFAMGYFISYAVSENVAPLAGTGFALLWSLVLSGVLPTLNEVYNPDSVLNTFSFLWTCSPVRWSIEALWIKEVQSLPFKDKLETPGNSYKWSNYSVDLTNIILIGLAWNAIAFFFIKMTNRSRQR